MSCFVFCLAVSFDDEDIDSFVYVYHYICKDCLRLCLQLTGRKATPLDLVHVATCLLRQKIAMAASRVQRLSELLDDIVEH